MPDVTRTELPSVGHTAPDNTGEPQRVADEVFGFSEGTAIRWATNARQLLANPLADAPK